MKRRPAPLILSVYIADVVFLIQVSKGLHVRGHFSGNVERSTAVGIDPRNVDPSTSKDVDGWTCHVVTSNSSQESRKPLAVDKTEVHISLLLQKLKVA